MRLRQRFIYWVLSLCILSPSGLVNAESYQLDLKSAIDLAATQNEEFRAVQQEAKRASARIRMARADAFPSLTFSGTYTRTFEIPEFVIGDQRFKFGVENQTLWGFTLEQAIFKGGKVFAAWSAANIYANMTDEQIESSRLDLELRTTIAFYDALFARRLVDAAAKRSEQAQVNYDVVLRKFQQGHVSEFERLRAEVELANARPPVLEAENGVRLADLNLKHTLGLSREDSLELVESDVPEAPFVRISVSEAVSSALQSRPAIHAASEQIRLARKGVRVAKADWIYPNISFAANYRWQMLREDFGYDSKDVTKDWNASLMLSIPLFDGLKTSGQIAEARVDLRQSELGLSDLEKLVALEVEQAHNAFEEANERLASQGETVRLAKEGLAIANVRYNNGIGTQLEVFDAQLALTVARVNLAKAERDLNVARAKIYRARGNRIFGNALGN